MSLKYKKSSGPPPDPLSIMIGKCNCCKSRVSCERWQARAPIGERSPMNNSGREGGLFDDMYSMECPVCKERSKHGFGTRVLLTPEKKVAIVEKEPSSGAERPEKVVVVDGEVIEIVSNNYMDDNIDDVNTTIEEDSVTT